MAAPAPAAAPLYFGVTTERLSHNIINDVALHKTKYK